MFYRRMLENLSNICVCILYNIHMYVVFFSPTKTINDSILHRQLKKNPQPGIKHMVSCVLGSGDELMKVIKGLCSLLRG